MPQSNEEKPPKKCPLCGWAIMEFKGVSARTRRPYHFWGCSNPQCRWVWRKPSKAELRHKEVMKALRIIYKKISALEKIREEFPCLAFFPDDEILKNLHLIEDKD